MKRSKLFLGITTGLLAVVAFTAAKTAKFSNLTNAYYTNGAPSHHCVIKASLRFYTQGSTVQATNGTGGLLFTYNHGADCLNPVFVSGAN